MLFDTTGGGASLAARFQVGQAVAGGGQQGGGLFQSVTVSTPGDYHLSVVIATGRLVRGPNSSASVYTLLLDGAAVDSHDFGPIFGITTLRSSLATVNLGAGNHELRVQITRPFTVPRTLNQYLDNARFDPVVTAVPEPSSLASLCVGAAAEEAGGVSAPWGPERQRR